MATLRNSSLAFIGPLLPLVALAQFHGELRCEHKAEWNEKDSDQDCYQYLSVETRRGRYNGALLFRLKEDIDGSSGPFCDIDDRNEHVEERLYYGYIELFNLLLRQDIRLGRQYFYGLDNVAHFDGATFMGEQPEIHLSYQGIFGKPVSFYSGIHGEWLMGGAVSYFPARWLGLKGDYLILKEKHPKLEEDSFAAGLILKLPAHVDVWSSLQWVNSSTQDLTFALRWTPRDKGLSGGLSFRRLLHPSEFKTRVHSTYYHLIGTYLPFYNLAGDLQVQLSETVFLGAGFVYRDVLGGNGDNLNHEFFDPCLSLIMENLLFARSRWELDLDFWLEGDDRRWDLGGSWRQSFGAWSWFRIGSGYSKYKYDDERDIEREGIYSVYAKLHYAFAHGFALGLHGEVQDGESESEPTWLTRSSLGWSW